MMVSTGEMEHAEKIVSRADDIWGWGTPAGKLRAQRRAKLLIRSTGMAAGKTVLELGCGTGVFSEQFAQTHARVTAIDISSTLLREARKRTVHAEFITADATVLPFPDRSFDIVTGSSVLHHLDLSAALPEISRVLKNKGKIAFAEPNMLNPQIALERSCSCMRRIFNATPEETAFYRWEISRALAKSGFINTEAVPFGFLHPYTAPGLIKIVTELERLLENIPVFSEIAGSLIISGQKS